VRRRRRFSSTFNRELMKRTVEAGASASGIALEHRLNPKVLFTWRRQYLRESGVLAAPSAKLPPVIIGKEELRSASDREAGSAGSSDVILPVVASHIEIKAFGACTTLRGAVDGRALRRVRAALPGR
jgi:transposase